jgi:FtsH-binding integral membrane protein
MLTLALVALIAVAFQGSPYAFFFGFMIMGLLYLLFAGLIAVAAYRVLKGLAPERTIKVLREDKVWLEKEARNEI